MIDASVAVQTGPDGTTVHACARCGQTFWFASLKPGPSWTCCYCAPPAVDRDLWEQEQDERGAHEYEMEQTNGPR